VPAQPACVVVLHCVPTQQAPGHGLTVHTVPTPRNELVAVGQLAEHVRMQLVVALLQQAPEAHGVGAQVTPTPGNMLAPHPATLISVEQRQVVASQQTPQGVGVQERPGSEVVPVGQPISVTVVQAPVMLLQQTRGHGLGLHPASGQCGR
jgi:hypothetical protein